MEDAAEGSSAKVDPAKQEPQAYKKNPKDRADKETRTFATDGNQSRSRSSKPRQKRDHKENFRPRSQAQSPAEQPQSGEQREVIGWLNKKLSKKNTAIGDNNLGIPTASGSTLLDGEKQKTNPSRRERGKRGRSYGNRGAFRGQYGQKKNLDYTREHFQQMGTSSPGRQQNKTFEKENKQSMKTREEEETLHSEIPKKVAFDSEHLRTEVSERGGLRDRGRGKGRQGQWPRRSGTSLERTNMNVNYFAPNHDWRLDNNPYPQAGQYMYMDYFAIQRMSGGFPDYQSNGYFPNRQPFQSGNIHTDTSREFVPRKIKSRVISEASKSVHVLDPSHSVQASMLTEQLLNESYECMVCCERIRCHDVVWNCQNCYHVFHLRCARKWAKSPTAVVEGENGGWRCPTCQNITKSVPNAYWCFCGKQTDPEWNPRDGITPHSCGELCHKKRESTNCPHLCNQLCHPGPCPSCPVMVTKSCECRKTSQQIRCGQSSCLLCTKVCQKPLNCKIHSCERGCHSGPCGVCDVETEQGCYCGKVKKTITCGTGDCDIVEDKTGYFSCEKLCERLLDCSNHECDKVCHKGVCTQCQLKPSLVNHCPCGKTLLDQILGEDNSRQSCLDSIPTCKEICGKLLPCSPKEGSKPGSLSEHHCKQPCHHGHCGPCDGVTSITCRCGASKKGIKCSEVSSEEYLCDQRCNQKRQCGRHRCNQKCCMDTEHKCELICGKKLRCGIHTCDELCHRGHCPSCFMTGFDELTCYCGATVLYPPIPCGTPPPECPLPCSRQHSCPHPANHTCHNEDSCPPCTMLTKKMCSGEHEMRYNIPCHVNDVSCGRACGRGLPCGHKCVKLCHKPPCLADQEHCTQPCQEPRKECDHTCNAPCHQGLPCPVTSCKVKITLNCKCGRRSEVVPCLQGGDKNALAQVYQRWTTEALANKMKDVQLGQTVDISGIMITDDRSLRQLDCNEECALLERNRRLADALDIDDPESPAFGIPHISYSPSLLSEARSNLTFIKSAEEAFENLVKTASKSQAGQRSHSFPPMNSSQRRIIHEMSVHYNCTSRSYDLEPKRNTVITATKESRVPSVILSTQIIRQMNPPAPPPVPYLPSKPTSKAKLTKDTKTEKKSKAWAQVPDYFADDFND